MDVRWASFVRVKNNYRWKSKSYVTANANESKYESGELKGINRGDENKTTEINPYIRTKIFLKLTQS